MVSSKFLSQVYEDGQEPNDVRNDVLTDERLLAGGLVRVSAFVRGNQSANAKRQERAREKAAALGLKQVNIKVPSEHHGLIRALAKELQSGCSVRSSLQQMLRAEIASNEPGSVVVVGSAWQYETLQKIAELKGWRRLLAQFIGLL